MSNLLLNSIVGHETQRGLWQRAFDQKHLPHAFLFVGPSGVGKKTAAKAFAQKLICPQGGCGSCGACLRVAQGSSESLLLVAAEERQIKIEQAKEVIKFLSLRSASQSQVVIIDEAEKLNPQAANALLKIIEEPPEGTYFFLIAPSEGAILSTLRSRCQVMRFSRLSDSELSQLTQTDLTDWRVSAAQGSLVTFEELSDPELKDLRDHAFHFMHKLLFSTPAGDEEDNFTELFKKREESGLLIGFWQQLLRDVRVCQAGGDQLVHKDYKLMIDEVAVLPSSLIDGIYELCLQLERDWDANIDRQVLLSAFQVELRQLKGSLHA